jgi:hypothetical protein
MQTARIVALNNHNKIGCTGTTLVSSDKQNSCKVEFKGQSIDWIHLPQARVQ